MESKKAELIETEWIGGCQALGSRGNREMLIKGYKLPALSSEDLIYSTVTIDNNTVLYKVAERLDLNVCTTTTTK